MCSGLKNNILVMNNRTIKIGTRGSDLALWQANMVKDLLCAKYPERTFELVIIKTKGDKILDVALSKIGDKGLFTKELEVELFDGNIDLAVHSLKDLPTVYPAGAKLGAVPQRGEFRDVLVSNEGKTLANLNENDVIATSSLRRKAQLLKINPKFNIVDIRGNVNTRLKKMDEGYCNVMIMAGAGLIRLGFNHRISDFLAPEVIIPACGQGAVGIEIRDNDPEIEDLLQGINHTESAITSNAERVFLNALEGGCQIPIGCFSKIEGENIVLTGFVAETNGTSLLREKVSGKFTEADSLAKELAAKLLAKGAASIVENIRNGNLQ